MKGSHAVRYTRLVGGMLIALATMLGGCVGQVEDEDEMLGESGQAVQVEQDEGTGRIDSPGVRSAPIIENSDPDPDPQPWHPLSAVEQDPQHGKRSSALSSSSVHPTNP